MTPEQAGCIGKHRFDDKPLAKQVARKFAQRHHCAGEAYRCPACGGWHIGSKIPGSTASKRKQYAEKKSVDQVRSPYVNDEDGAGAD